MQKNLNDEIQPNDKTIARMEKYQLLDKTWELAEKIFIQLHAIPNTKNIKTSEYVKMSYKIAEEFIMTKDQSLNS